MINKKEKIRVSILAMDFDLLRALWIDRVKAEKARIGGFESWMRDQGYREIVVPDGALLTADGCEVLHAHGKAWALPLEEHIKRRQAALDAAQETERARIRRQSGQREGIAAATCPQMVGGKPCGGALNRGPVCPSCATGRMGYKYRYSCESCGFDIVTKTELSND